MNFVLDASVALAWCFSDEATPASAELLDQLSTGSIVYVPAIWPLEVGNVLMGALKRHRISYAAITQFLDQVDSLNIQVDTETASKAFHDILALSHSEGLTTYDASYLELAMRKGIAIASKDKELCRVAIRLGVIVITV